MAPMMPIFRKAYWTLAILGGIYLCFLTALINPTLQRKSVSSSPLPLSFPPC